MPEGTLTERAREVATRAHAGQFRKDGKTPYITHHAAVVGLLESIGIQKEDALAAAWLHDTIEDCGLTETDIATEFNPNVGRIVAAVTRDVDREQYKQRIAAADYDVQIVKLADTLHNVLTLERGMPEKTIQRKVEDCQSFYL